MAVILEILGTLKQLLTEAAGCEVLMAMETTSWHTLWLKHIAMAEAFLAGDLDWFFVLYHRTFDWV